MVRKVYPPCGGGRRLHCLATSLHLKEKPPVRGAGQGLGGREGGEVTKRWLRWAGAASGLTSIIIAQGIDSCKEGLSQVF